MNKEKPWFDCGTYKGKPWYFWDAIDQVKNGFGPWLELFDSGRELSLRKYCDSKEDLKSLGIWPYGTRIIDQKSRIFEVFLRYQPLDGLPFCYQI